MNKIEKIIKDCFWDLDISPDEIKEIVKSKDFRKEKFLFEKILLNSSQMLAALQIFEKDDLRKLLEDFKVPAFNHDYIFRRKNIAEVYFLGKSLLIKELQWKV